MDLMAFILSLWLKLKGFGCSVYCYVNKYVSTVYRYVFPANTNNERYATYGVLLALVIIAIVAVIVVLRQLKILK